MSFPSQQGSNFHLCFSHIRLENVCMKQKKCLNSNSCCASFSTEDGNPFFVRCAIYSFWSLFACSLFYILNVKHWSGSFGILTLLFHWEMLLIKARNNFHPFRSNYGQDRSGYCRMMYEDFSGDHTFVFEVLSWRASSTSKHPWEVKRAFGEKMVSYPFAQCHCSSTGQNWAEIDCVHSCCNYFEAKRGVDQNTHWLWTLKYFLNSSSAVCFWHRKRPEMTPKNTRKTKTDVFRPQKIFGAV